MYPLFKSLLSTSPYLSLVILSVEEVCIPGQVYHRSDVVLGLVNDGQVEQPTETARVNVQTNLQQVGNIFHVATSDTQCHSSVWVNEHTPNGVLIY